MRGQNFDKKGSECIVKGTQVKRTSPGIRCVDNPQNVVDRELTVY